MAELFHDRFTTGIEGWGTGTRVAVESADLNDADGVLRVGPGAAGTRAIGSTVSSGLLLTEWWLKSTTLSATASAAVVLYVLPNTTVDSSNSLAAIAFNRDSVTASDRWNLIYRDSAGWQNADPLEYQVGEWYKISLIVDLDNDLWHLRINDVLWHSGISVPNSGQNATHLAIATQANTPDTDFDNIRVEDSWAWPETTTIFDHDFTAGSGALENATPDTHRDINAQAWVIPRDTTNFGAGDLGTNGITFDGTLSCSTYHRARPEGIFECEWHTSVTNADMYFSLGLRMWGGDDGENYTLFRYWQGGGGSKVALFSGGNTLASAASAAGLSISADTTYTLRVIARGRYLWCYIKQGVIGDANTYQLQFGGAHQITSEATGARFLSEERIGVILPTNAASVGVDNYCRRYRVLGEIPADELNLTVGSHSFNLSHGSVREYYHSGSGGPTKNLGLSKLIQGGHRSSADPGNYAQRQLRIFNTANVQCVRQAAHNLREDIVLGYCDLYWTFTRRGAWLWDSQTVYDIDGRHVAPDHDFRGVHLDTAYKTIDASPGTVDDRTDAFQDWTTIYASGFPYGFQRHTNFGTGSEIRFTAGFKSLVNWGAGTRTLLNKNEGKGDPNSNTVVLEAASLSVDTTYTIACAYLLELGALSSSVLSDWRDDLQTIATLDFTGGKGSSKTDATGDADADGFNERHGWYELTADGSGATDFIFQPGSTTRQQPQFRINSWATGALTVLIDGSNAVDGTDYVLDDLGDGSALLQILSNTPANTQFSVLLGVEESSATRPTHSTTFSRRVIPVAC